MNRDATLKHESDQPKKKSKGKWSEMIRSFVSSKINQYLGKYLNNIKKDDLETNIGTNSAITLTNLQLRKDAFDDLRLPIEVDPTSVVRELRCELRMLPIQVHINLKGVRVLVRPNCKSWSSGQWSDYKEKHLKEWEESQKHLFENLNLKSYKQRKLNMITNNINITIEDIIILYEDEKISSIPCAIRLRVEEFKIVTTTPDFIKEKHCSSETVTFRRITLKDFSVAIKKKTEYGEISEYSERMYVVRPLSVFIRHKMIHKGNNDQPVHTVNAHITNLVLSLNDTQKQILEALGVQVDKQAMYNKYEENRPSGYVTEGNAQEWWNYLIKSCNKDMDLNFIGLIKNKRNMDKYIDYYKSCQEIIHAPWLRDESEDKRDFLLRMEIELPLEKIILYRTLALYQLRIEAMSYVKARGNVRGRTHLGDLWDYYLNDFESLLGDPYKTVAEEHEIELSLTEKEELNHLLRLDELNIVNSYLNGTSSSRNDKLVKIDLEIEHIRIFIQETQGYDEECFRIISKSECVCLRCKPSSGFSEMNSPNIRERNDGKGKLEGAIISIVMVSSDGRSYDPQLVKESTLLIIEASLKGSFMLFRDMHIETGNSKEKLIISNIEILDPLTFQDCSKNDHLKQNYGFNSATDLLNNILQGNAEDYPIINSFRFFLQEYKLIPEFEFLIHFKGLTEKTMHLCTCKHKSDHNKGLKAEFFNRGNPLCLHLTQEQLEKFENGANLDSFYNETMTVFRKRIMPRYIRNCIRWIIGNSIKSNIISKSFMKISIGWKGKSSPLQVQFNKSKKRNSENNFDKIFDEKKIKIRGDLLEACISTETVHSLIKFVAKPEEQFVYQNSFTNSLGSSHPKIDYLKTLLKNIKKKGKQLYYILAEKHNKIVPEVNVLFKKVVITLMETLFSIGNSENSNTVIKITSLIFQPQKNLVGKYQVEKNLNSENTSRITSVRTKNIIKDYKFYSGTRFEFLLAEIVTKEILVMRVEKFSMISKNCHMEAHPYLIENISEINISKIEINVCEELLGFLGLITTLDTTPPKSATAENDKIKSMKKKVFETEKKSLKSKLMQCQEQHYKIKNLKKCPHCILSYRKICKTFTFSIGQANDNELGLQIRLFNYLNRDSVTLYCQVVTGISEEMVFSKKLQIYMSDFEEKGLMKVNLFETKGNEKFDPNEKSPLFTIEHYSSSNVPNQAVTCASRELPLYLLLCINAKKDAKIFDIGKWKKKENFFRNNHLEFVSNKLDLSFTGVEDPVRLSLKRSNSYKKINIEYDIMKLKIHSIVFEAKEVYHFPQIFSIIFSFVSFQLLYSQYQKCVNWNKAKRPVEIRNLVQINKIVINSSCVDFEFNLNIEKLMIKSFPTVKKNTAQDKTGLIFNSDTIIFDRNFPESEFEFDKVIKQEKLEDTNFCCIDSITIEIPSFTLKISSFCIKTLALVKQHKKLLISESFISTIIEETQISNKITMKNLLLTRNSQETPLISLQHIQENEEFSGFECENLSNTVNLQQFRELNIKVFPLFLYVQGKNIARFANKLKKLLQPLIDGKVASLLSIPEKYIFFNLRFLEVLPYRVSVNFTKVYSEFLLKKTIVSKIKLAQLTLNNSKNFSIFTGEIGSLGFKSNIEKYRKILVPAKKRVPIQITFNLEPSSQLYKISFKNAKIVFLSKVIEENINILNYISKKISSEGKKEESKASVKVIFESSSVLVPKSSLADEFLLLKFDKAEVQTFSSREVPWKLPKKNQFIYKYDKEVSLLSNPEDTQVQCTLISINLHNVFVLHNEQQIGSIKSASMVVYIPVDKTYEKFTLKNKVNLELFGTNFKVSLARMKQIEDVVNSNIDEPLENVEKIFKSKNTKFNVKISNGKLSIERWVTQPWDNMRIVRIKQESKDVKSNLLGDNFVIHSENEDQKSSSVVAESVNPFNVVKSRENSSREFDEKSEIKNSQDMSEFDQDSEVNVEVIDELENTAGNPLYSDSVSDEATNFMT